MYLSSIPYSRPKPGRGYRLLRRPYGRSNRRNILRLNYLANFSPTTNDASVAQADLVQKFKLWPRYKLTLCSSDPSAFGWAYMEPLKDARPCWARPRVLFRFCDIDPRPDTLPTGYDPVRETSEAGALRTALWRDVCTQVQRHFTLQQLAALHVVLVRDDATFRVTRWDRTGVVATEWVDCADKPRLLADLFWRASMLSDEQLGFDATAAPVLPGSAEHELMDGAARPRADDFDYEAGTTVEGDPGDLGRAFKFARAEFKKALTSSPFLGDGQPRWKLTVPSASPGDAPREFLVGAPLKYQKGAFFDWRNARGYVALDCRTEGFVFLKDTWRELDQQPDGSSEGDCLEKLNKAGVPHVPTLLCHADLENTKTPVPDSADATDAEDAELERRRHYRMVVKEFCLPLARILSGRQFVSAMKDCVSAHAAAARSVGILHGDISFGNLMIVPKIHKSQKTAKPVVKWEGILIDWESAQPLPSPSNKPMSGPGPDSRMTWQFASFAYIHDRTRPLEIADELESFFYVLLYAAVRFLRSTCPPSHVQPFLDGFFDHDYVDDVGWAISTWKRYALEHARLFVPPDGDGLRFLGGLPPPPSRPRAPTSNARGEKEKAACTAPDTPLNSLVEELLSWFHARFVERFNGAEGAVLDERHFIPMEDPPDIERDPRTAQLDTKALARKLADHGAMLELFEKVLAERWPEHDLAGDRLENELQKQVSLVVVLTAGGGEERPLHPAQGRRDSIETISRMEEEEVITVLLPRKTNTGRRKPAQRRPGTKTKETRRTGTKTGADAPPRATRAMLVVPENKVQNVLPRRSKRLRHEPPSEDQEGKNRRPKRQCRR
ncbi:hypothetical protein GSI_07392 [Ganoderma sinense ZZ0214-1]|uniref:Fungal-type protein kinase domain-containing protein n=1 Tax=Ganoderma sinense ZZ0214-1 TaxID=1077348 RepID=A0A2G8SAQ5_9APHY|nr:hypothetical protein GSI_07392 [Ganoderma sinense ZZ0214-1]